MLPFEFVQRIKSQDYIDSESLIKALSEPSPVSIRINKSKWNHIPADSQQVPWCSTGYYLPSRPSYTVDPLFHSGCYYPQEASSMFTAEAFRQISGSGKNLVVLDLCGSPGGKTIILSDLLEKESLLISNEVIRQRASVLAETVSKWGSVNCIVTQNDPEIFGRLTGYFDIILVDAPCSGEGMFRSETARSEWSVDNTVLCSERQKRILMDVWPALRENGILIYSTCTFNPGENEDNIRWLVGQKKAESVKLDISGYPGINEIDYMGIRGYGFYPDKQKGEGFFIALVRKKESPEHISVKINRKNELKPSKQDLLVSGKYTLSSDERIIRWSEELIALPCKVEDYSFLFHNLKIIRPGTSLFIVKNNDYLPSHDLALSGLLRPGSFETHEISLQESLSYLRRDSFKLHSIEKGWQILTFKGIPLGFIKGLGNRFNNYFPVEWRIRMNLPESGTENIIRWQ